MVKRRRPASEVGNGTLMAPDSGAHTGKIRPASQGMIQFFCSDGNDDLLPTNEKYIVKENRVVRTFEYEFR